MVPPAFAHERVKVYVPAVVSVTACDPPPTALQPLHPVPPAVHEVGLLPVAHVTVVLPPAVIVLGETDTETFGFAMTVMLTDLDPEPALLLHERVKVYVPAVRFELPPLPVVVGLADIETTGGLTTVPLVAVTLVVALPVPPALVQLRV